MRGLCEFLLAAQRLNKRFGLVASADFAPRNRVFRAAIGQCILDDLDVTPPCPRPKNRYLNVMTKVLYNDECPICSFEIKHYDKIAQEQGVPLQCEPLSEAAETWDIDADTAARRLHINHDGKIISGMPAFFIIWSEIPRYRWLARTLNQPIIRPVTVKLYDHIAAPLLYALHKRRQRRATR